MFLLYLKRYHKLHFISYSNNWLSTNFESLGIYYQGYTSAAGKIVFVITPKAYIFKRFLFWV